MAYIACKHWVVFYLNESSARSSLRKFLLTLRQDRSRRIHAGGTERIRTLLKQRSPEFPQTGNTQHEPAGGVRARLRGSK